MAIAIIDNIAIDMGNATWKWMPGFGEHRPRYYQHGELAIYAYEPTNNWGKSEIAVWVPDACSKNFTPIQQRIADTPKNREYCETGRLWTADDIDF